MTRTSPRLPAIIIADQDITAHTGVRVQSFKDGADSVTVTYLDSGRGATRELEVDYVMVATGRKPATEGLGPGEHQHRNQRPRRNCRG